MGQFSYECSRCGGHDQFDWEDICVVKLGDSYIKAEYDGYGRTKVFVVTNPSMFEKFQEKCASDGVSLIAGYEERWRENMKEEDKDKLGDGVKTPLPLDVGGAIIEVQLEQFSDYFSTWHGGLGGSYLGRSYNIIRGTPLSSVIYCCGDKDKIEAAKKEGKIAKKWECEDEGDDYKRVLGGIMSNEDDYSPDERYCVPDGVKVRDYIFKSELDGFPKVELDLSKSTRSASLGPVYWKMIEASDVWKHQKEQLIASGMSELTESTWNYP